MTREQKIEEIRHVCEGAGSNLSEPTNMPNTVKLRPVRLADVLLPIVRRSRNEYLTYRVLAIVRRWNCLQDNLNLQEDSTVDFIHDLLKKV